MTTGNKRAVPRWLRTYGCVIRETSLFLLATLMALPAWSAGMATSPEMLYRLNCAGCHQIHGGGVSESGIPPLRSNIGHFLRSRAGRQFLIQVPGTANAPISDEDVARLLNWLVPHFAGSSLPEKFDPYTAIEVQKERRGTPADVMATRDRIVKELRATGWPVN